MTAPHQRLRRIGGWFLTILSTTAVVVITLTVGWRPVFGAKSRPLTDRQFERTPERLSRGKYLVEGVAACFDCHAELPKQELKPGQAPVFSNHGAGRVLINEKNFVVAAPNITPDLDSGAGTWTDDQFARAIREGIGHDGRTLFPMMPYEDFRHLSDEDLASIVVYIRSLPPVHNELPKPQIPFPLSRLINSAPQPVGSVPASNDSSPIERGRYLVHVAHCINCHTPRDSKGKPLPGMEFAGGADIDGFGVASANITPDPSGIGYYDEKLFIRTLRTGHVGARPLRPPMPWWVFRNMSDEDLKAIFAYLRTVKPVHHRVDNSETASQCKVCNAKHGAGAENGGT